jgi:hypothetical protein
VVIRKSYGFKTAEILKISLYHKLGKLPVPDIAQWHQAKRNNIFNKKLMKSASH